MVLLPMIVYFGSFALSWAAGEFDFDRARVGQKPWFALEVAQYKDGGSIGYRGFGYSLKKVRQGVLPNLLVGAEIQYEWHLLWPVFGHLRQDRSNLREVVIGE
jgi:hypothetical protein